MLRLSVRYAEEARAAREISVSSLLRSPKPSSSVASKIKTAIISRNRPSTSQAGQRRFAKSNMKLLCQFGIGGVEDAQAAPAEPRSSKPAAARSRSTSIDRVLTTRILVAGDRPANAPASGATPSGSSCGATTASTSINSPNSADDAAQNGGSFREPGSRRPGCCRAAGTRRPATWPSGSRRASTFEHNSSLPSDGCQRSSRIATSCQRRSSNCRTTSCPRRADERQ